MTQDDPHDPIESAPSAQAAGDHLARLLVENAVDLIVRGDATRNRAFVSPSAREILGYEPADLLGGQPYGLIHPDDVEEVRKQFTSLGPDRPRNSIVFRMRRSDGRYIWVEGRYRFLPQDGTILAMLRDITAQKRAELALAETVRKLEASNRLLARLANRDGLTGIANRRCFDDRLDAEFRRSVRQHLSLSVVMIDVDCFKLYNDRYGHVAGDKCLMRIAAAVAGALLRPGDLAARYGGEEIAVLLPATDLAGAIVIAERIRLAVADLAIPHAGNLHGVATISAGVSAVRPRRTNDQPGDLVEAADRALYRAKTDGRNRVRGGFSSDTVRDQHAEYVATA